MSVWSDDDSRLLHFGLFPDRYIQLVSSMQPIVGRYVLRKSPSGCEQKQQRCHAGPLPAYVGAMHAIHLFFPSWMTGIPRATAFYQGTSTIVGTEISRLMTLRSQ